MSLTATQKTLRGLVAVAALLFLSVGTMAVLSSRWSSVNKATLSTYLEIAELKDSLSALQDIETGNRGYALTSKSEFLEPLVWGTKSTRLHLAALKRLIGDDPDDTQTLAHLQDLAQQKIDFSDRVVEATKATQNKAAQVVGEGLGKRIMDKYRVEVAAMQRRKENLLNAKLSELASVQQLVWLSIAVISIFSITLLYWIFQISTNALKEEKTRVNELNQEIEQRKRVEKALKDTTLRLTSSNTDLQQFAYVASHDLQEPLRAVSGFVQLLAAKNKQHLDEESLVWVNHAVEGSQRMRTLINDLLSYARIESRGKEFTRINLNDVLERVTHDLSVSIAESHTSIRNDKLPTVIGDPVQLAQLFQNLIANAVKFRSDADPVITIKSTVTDQDNVISIKDNGRGFDMEHAERIFVIFQRLQGRTEAAGTGIGLAVCKKIVERHRGRIWVESKVGDGTTFFFTLPTLEAGEENDNA
jgi:signal transduction histidine kinase